MRPNDVHVSRLFHPMNLEHYKVVKVPHVQWELLGDDNTTDTLWMSRPVVAQKCCCVNPFLELKICKKKKIIIR